MIILFFIKILKQNNSKPIVGKCSFSKTFFVAFIEIHDFPTFEFPIIKILKDKSFFGKSSGRIFISPQSSYELDSIKL